MVKIYFALGHQDLENYIKSSKPLLEKKINDTIQFTGAAIYREGIIKNIENNPPDILLLREGLTGTTNISDIVYQIRMKFPSIRIIFIAGDRNAGDPLLSTLVNYGIYDILVGNRVNAKDLLRKICKPNTLADVSFLVQKVTVDESTNQQSFEVPGVDLVKENQIRNDKDSANVKLMANDKAAHDLLENLVQEQEKEDQKDSLTETIHSSREAELMNDFGFANDGKSSSLLEQAKNNEAKINSQNLQKELPVEEIVTPIRPIQQIHQEGPIVKPLKPLSLNKDIEEEPETFEQNREVPIDENYNFSETLKQPTQHYENKNRAYLEKEIQTIQGNDIFNAQVLKESSKYSEQFSQKIITFIGGNRGVGNTQLAFNTALNIAMTGKKTLYIDTNPIYCYSDALYQLSYENMGLNTALKCLETGNLLEIERAIATTSKLMSFVANNSNLSKLYDKFPSNFDFLTFSQEHLTRKNVLKIDNRYFNQLIEYLITKLGYEMIVIDAVCDIYNDLSILAILNSHKIFATISQDYGILTNYINMMRYLDREAIEFRSKVVFILNKFQKHMITAKTVYSLMENNLQMKAFQMITLPDIYLDFLTANSSNLPIMWTTKNKVFIKGMQEIIKNI